jgi:hypothetical protein
MKTACSILIATALVCVPALALARGQATPTQPQPKSEPTKPQPQDPTLDELLGLPKATPVPSKPQDAPGPLPDGPKPDAPDRAKAELERQLSPAEVSEAFEQAVALMGQTADRLDKSHDPGLDTQRMQEDVIRKLDMLIEQAKKQQNKSKSKSKKPDSGQQQQQQQQSSQQNSKTTDPKQGGGPDLMTGGTHASPGGSAVWGNLPEHVRNALKEGSTDQFSSMYKTLTEKYYKRLAEEPKPGESPLTPTPTPAPEPAPKP